MKKVSKPKKTKEETIARITFSCLPATKKWVENQADLANRNVSNYIDSLIRQAMEAGKP